MSNSEPKDILDLPDEILENYLLPLLTFDDLLNLAKCGNIRLKSCAKMVAKNKAYSK